MTGLAFMALGVIVAFNGDVTNGLILAVSGKLILIHDDVQETKSMLMRGDRG